MRQTLVVLASAAGIAVLVVISGAVWARVLFSGGIVPSSVEHAATSSETFMISDGEDIAEGTIIGLHVELGGGWTITDGSRRSGSMMMENARLGCDVVVIVASPVKAFPHYMEDKEGSLAILEKFAGAELADAESYLYPTAGGGAIETLSQMRIDDSRYRIAVAREFGAIDSAIFIDFGCDAFDDLVEVFEREFVAEVPAFVTD